MIICKKCIHCDEFTTEYRHTLYRFQSQIKFIPFCKLKNQYLVDPPDIPDDTDYYPNALCTDYNYKWSIGDKTNINNTVELQISNRSD